MKAFKLRYRLLGRSLAPLMAVSTNAALAAQAGVPGGDGEAAFTNVTTVVCGVANAFQGPLGIGIGFLVLVAGLIAMQVASRDALPMITRAAVGTALLIGAGAAFGALLVQPCA